jgi:diketogulonate reductase-like aldo/keto reductase
MRYVDLPSGERIPAFGVGTWRMGERPGARDDEVRALQLALDLGVTLIDTAEMYGEGEAERIVGEAVAGRRDEVFIVSKVYPHNASRSRTLTACERSLQHLGTDRIDLYLLHWRGGVPLEETVAAFEQLQADGKIRHWGVSNLDLDDMEELLAVPGGERVATNQVLYNLARRNIEYEILPFCRERGIPVMAYSPLDQGRIEGHRGLAELSARMGTTRAVLALAWVLQQEGVVAIPKAVRPEHVRDNLSALDLPLDADTIELLDAMFPPPAGPARLPIY